jgi:hypothetical protein
LHRACHKPSPIAENHSSSEGCTLFEREFEFDFGVVVDAGEAEAEEFKEFGLVAGEGGEGVEVGGGDVGPDLFDGSVLGEKERDK